MFIFLFPIMFTDYNDEEINEYIEQCAKESRFCDYIFQCVLRKINPNLWNIPFKVRDECFLKCNRPSYNCAKKTRCGIQCLEKIDEEIKVTPDIEKLDSQLDIDVGLIFLLALFIPSIAIFIIGLISCYNRVCQEPPRRRFG